VGSSDFEKKENEKDEEEHLRYRRLRLRLRLRRRLRATLMPTPKRGYFLSDGARVPGVTTILGRFKDMGGLLHWAWEEGCAGRDYRETRDAAADAGTLAHAMVEAEIRGKRFVVPEDTPPEIRNKACQAYSMYNEWATQTRLQPLVTEVQLVSEQHRFGGTLDVVLVGGRRLLGDWKTSGAIYTEHLLQLAAYDILWKENRPAEPIEGYQIVRFSKEEADFEQRYFMQLDVAEEMFLLLRRAYDLDKKVRKRVR